MVGRPRGLRLRLRADLKKREVGSLHMPCVFGCKLSTWVWHGAVLLRVKGKRYAAKDRLLGRDDITREEFARKWVESVIEVERIGMRAR